MCVFCIVPQIQPDELLLIGNDLEPFELFQTSSALSDHPLEL